MGIAGAGLALGATPLTLVGTVLIAHTGMDRSVGYGLKFVSGFGDTHLGRIGKSARGEAAVPASRAEAATSAVAG